MLWQRLAEVDFLQGASVDEEFVASFVLQFLVMECIAASLASHANIAQHLPREKVDHDLELESCDPQCVLIELTRQPPESLARASKGKDAINKAAVRRERPSEPSRDRSVHLFCTALGLESIFFVRSSTKCRCAPVIPDVALLSFVFCEIRKEHETGSTRYRDWQEGSPAKGVGGSLAAAWCGETFAVDETSMDDMERLLGPCCFVSLSETRTCVRWLPIQEKMQLTGCAIPLHIPHNLQSLPAHPPTSHQSKPPNHNLQSLSNGTQPPSTPTSSPSPLDSTPTPDEPPKHNLHLFPTHRHSPSLQHPIPFHWTTAHLQTCTRCNLHICIRTHVHTSDSLVSSPTTVVYVSNSVAALKTKRSYRPAAQQPTPTPTIQQPQPTQPSQPRCALCSYAGNECFSHRPRCNPAQDLFDGSSLSVCGGNCTHAPPPALLQPSPSPPRNP